MVSNWLLSNQEIIRALGPLAIAGTALVVGFLTLAMNLHFNRLNARQQQSAEAINRSRLRVELFDKRYAVYETAWEYVRAIQRPPLDEERFYRHDENLIKIWHQAQFLFPDDAVANKLQELRGPVYELHGLLQERQTLIEGFPAESRPPKVQQQVMENWRQQQRVHDELRKQLDDLPQLFEPHLHISETS